MELDALEASRGKIEMSSKKKPGIILLEDVSSALAEKAGASKTPDVVNNGGAEDQADLKIQLAKKALDAIMQAGNGLVAAANDMEHNTANAQTIAVLIIVAGYVNDALNFAVEREFSGILGL